MKPFLLVAQPHRDVLEGRLTMDVFAADLWEVFQGRAPDEYQDPEVFFRKTYLTAGLKNLLDIAQRRLEGKGGDPVIQLQTPFGGGKTHSLIALYHKAKEWKANVVVIDGTTFDPKEKTIWEEMEKQLTGQVKVLKGQTSPGKEKLRSVFEKHQPLLILIDELLHYTAQASGIMVGESSLATQVLTFIQEITGVVKTLEKSLLILTLPSSLLEHYDNEKAERLFQEIQRITGRTEKVYTPVNDEEIASVIRRRLFNSVKEAEAREIIEDFLDYAERERILPEGVEKPEYREKFLKSYPFLPEVIDVIYKKWGSFPSFQRTRGVLRLLALVIHSLKDSSLSYIRLGDFDLKNDEIKRELIKHIGEEYSSIIAADITSSDAGAKKVDRKFGDSYAPYSLGTKAATTIFLYSHSGGPEKGATLNDIKLSSAVVGEPSAVIADVVNELRGSLFYLWEEDGKLLFKNQPNINRILLVKKEGISEPDLRAEEERILKEYLKKDYFEIFVWPKKSTEIPDNKKLKLIIMEDAKEEKCKEILEEAGTRPRVYRNSLIFLCPLEAERLRFENFLKSKKAYEMVKSDKNLALTDEQRKEIENKLKQAETETYEEIRNLYQLVRLPSREGFKESYLGKYTVGEEKSIDKIVYQRLKDEQEILEKIGPKVLKDKYLGNKDFVGVVGILESFYKTPGELRITSEEALKESIKEGVMRGLFGLGEIEKDKPKCLYFKTDCFPELVESEVLMKKELCVPEEGIPDDEFEKLIERVQKAGSKEELNQIQKEAESTHLSEKQKSEFEAEVEKRRKEIEGGKPPIDTYQSVKLKLNVPHGKLSDVVRIVNFIKDKFSLVDIKVEITCEGGEISISDYEDKVKEAIAQSSIELEREEKE